MTTFIRKNDDDGSIDRSLLARQFQTHLTGGRPHDVVALLDLIAGHAPTADGADQLATTTPQVSMSLDEPCSEPRPRVAGSSRKHRCVTLDELSVWITTAMHVNGDAPSSPGATALVTEARTAVLDLARGQLAEVFPDAWIGQACDVDGAVIEDELDADHQEITFAEYRSRLEWSPLLRIAADVGIAHNERLATVGG